MTENKNNSKKVLIKNSLDGISKLNPQTISNPPPVQPTQTKKGSK